MSKGIFCGTGCALVTPFKDGGVDFEGLDRLTERQIEAGTDALIVLGTTGEPCTLSDAEADQIVERTVSRTAGRIPVIAGAGSNDTRAAVLRAKRMCRLGADALLCVTPYYNRANQQGLTKHFLSIADAVDVPLILYNVPSRTGVNLLPETMEELLRHPNIQGIKDAGTDIIQTTRLMEICGDGCHVYCGNDDRLLAHLALGMRGVISVAANVIPKKMCRITKKAFSNEWAEARRMFFEIFPLLRALGCDVNPIPIKAALSEAGLIENELRLPLTPLSTEKTEMLKKALDTVICAV